MSIPSVLLCAPASGSGKTLVTCGILQALADRGLKVVSFKCGPDYIDPMFHGRVIGARSRNLDTFFTDEDTTRYLFAKNAAGCDVAVVEGVMGYYDGLGGTNVKGSTFDVARTLDIPSVLLVDCQGASLSVLAMARGFLEYRKDSHIRAAILNRISPMVYGQLKPLMEQELGIKVLGYVPKQELTLGSRHLGLVLPGEIERLKDRLHGLAAMLEETLDLDGLLQLAREGSSISEAVQVPGQVQAYFQDAEKIKDPAYGGKRLRIAVAQDDAFCFTYLDNLELLEETGAELVPFSPLTDTALPKGISGLILSGGYPELHAEKLAANTAMRESIQHAILQGLPCIAECGGFLYLHRELEGDDGIYYPMAGALDAKAYRTKKLSRFGYITLEAKEDQLLGKAGTKVRGHEFHYWDSERCGESFHASKPAGKREWDCVCATRSLYAGFPHLFYYSNLQVPLEFLRKCKEYRPC